LSQSSEHIISLNVNGTVRRCAVEARTLLVHCLREQLQLTGTHIGCNTSQCGACTVLLDGEAVKSCTMFAVQADGRSVTTVEGLATGGQLHPVQEAFHQHHGLQCGYCTPGFMMSTVSLLAGNPSPSPEEIAVGLEGNICRCTGYINIERAVLAAAEALSTPEPDESSQVSAGTGAGYQPR
jgi:Aerobic-type carbon monoxide dehydrogenase, small subunit CoxS/CutS homologs